MTEKEDLIETAQALGIDTVGLTAVSLKTAIEVAEAQAGPAEVQAAPAEESTDSPAEDASGAPASDEAVGDNYDLPVPTARRGGGKKKKVKSGSKRYRCLTNVSNGARNYDIGSMITLTDAQAKPIMKNLELV